MRERKKRNLIIGLLCLLLVFMGTGYAILSQTLNFTSKAKMTGVWSVQIQSARIKEKYGMATGTVPEIESAKIRFETDFYAPGDFIIYELVIENVGNISAKLAKIEGIPESDYIDYYISGIQEGQVLSGVGEAGDSSVVVTIRVELPDEIDTLPTDSSANLMAEIDFVFEQTAGSEAAGGVASSGSGVTPCFTIDSSGTLTDYDYSCGYDVVVPESVDGIPVQAISSSTFMEHDVLVYHYYMYRDEELRAELADRFNYKNVNYYLVTDSANFEVIREILATNEVNCNTLTDEECAAKQEEVIVDISTLSESELLSLRSAFVFMPAICDTATGLCDTFSHHVNTLDLSNATYLKRIHAWSFSGPVNQTSVGSAPLRSINFGNISSLSIIESGAFLGNHLTTLTLPEGLETIQDTVFAYNKLTSVTIPSTITTIRVAAFIENADLTTIRIKRSSADGITMANNWYGNATVVYEP